MRAALTGWLILLTAGAMTMAQEKAAERQEVAGQVTAVTLYRGQALITRTVELPAKQGHTEIVVSNLPQQIVSDSLFAEGEGVEVRAVRYRERIVGEEPREEVRALDQQIVATQSKITRNQQMQALLGKRSEYLDKLESFIAGTGKGDLENGALNGKTLQEITTFVFEQRGKVLEDTLAAGEEARLLQEELSLLQQKRSQMTNSSSRSVREAVLFLNQNNEKASVRLNYLVNSAGWSPAYNFRATGGEENIQVEYYALINQMTGEDWSQVKLTLSTASPALSAATPGLAPFKVSLVEETPQQQNDMQSKTELVEQYGLINRNLNSARMGQNSAQTLTANFDNNWRMNFACNDLQMLELTNSVDTFKLLRLEAPQDVEGPSIDYRLAAAVSLESRDDQQMVRIMELNLPTEYYHVATPMLSRYVYREAQLRNTSDNDLLGGPITVYLNGRFVGRSEIPTVARGENFVIGLGADSQLRTRRELVEKKESVQGGNQELNFTYRVVLENYKDADVTVRVFDRIPVSNREADVRVTMDPLAQQLSEDRLYVRLEKPKGILRWDVAVKAGASGEQAQLIEYGYRMQYDRKFALKAGLNVEAQQQEFNELQNKRLKF